jgi:hypothetical protein
MCYLCVDRISVSSLSSASVMLVSVSNEIASKALTLGGTLITRTAVGAGNWIFVQTAFKSKANNGNEFVPLVYSSFRSYLTLELKLPIGEVYILSFQIQPLFDVSDIILVVESNLGLPNILRDVVVYFTTLDPLVFVYQAI